MARRKKLPEAAADQAAAMVEKAARTGEPPPLPQREPGSDPGAPAAEPRPRRRRSSSSSAAEPTPEQKHEAAVAELTGLWTMILTVASSASGLPVKPEDVSIMVASSIGMHEKYGAMPCELTFLGGCVMVLGPHAVGTAQRIKAVRDAKRAAQLAAAKGSKAPDRVSEPPTSGPTK